MKMTLGVQIVYKDRTTAKLSGARSRVSASAFLPKEKQMKKKNEQMNVFSTAMYTQAYPVAISHSITQMVG